MSLPSKYIVKLGKFTWTTMWQIMMSQLAPSDKSGSYIRPESQFRNRVSNATNSSYPAAKQRYRLYVGMSCPWAHRTLVTRALKGLENAIAQGRSTVPILWDDETKTIVNNESAEIIEILNSGFNEFATNPDLELYPEALREQIDNWNTKIYSAINNGVYRCGFAQTQSAYELACNELFTVLDEIDAVLETNRYLCGQELTLADIRLFTTLFRFDIAYYGLFKCNRRRIQDYKNLAGYLRDIYQLPGVANTCDLEQVKKDYYGNLFPLNPGGIIPVGGNLNYLLEPHYRENIAQ